MRAIQRTMNAQRSAVAGAALLLALAAASQGAHAQTQAQGQPAQQQIQAQAGQAGQVGNYRGVRLNELLGTNVVSPQGQNLGTITDLVLNMNNGEVRYAVLDFDPEILTEDLLFAVPLNQLRMAQGGNTLVYENMDRQRLAVAAIRRANFNEGVFGMTDYWSNVDKAWGIQQPTNSTTAILASNLMNKDVVNTAGEEIGEIETMVVNMANQRVHYTVMAFDPGWLSPERKVAVPLNAYGMTPNREELVLNIDRQNAARLRPLDANWYANMNNPDYLVDVDRYLITVVPAAAYTGTAGQMGMGMGDGVMGSGPMGAGAGMFNRLDRDRSGWIEQGEAANMPPMQRQWQQMDQDGDGRVSRQEFGGSRGGAGAANPNR